MPPKKRIRVPPKKMEEAVKEVLEKKMPLRSVATAYNMSKSHLGRLVKQAKSSGNVFKYTPNIGNRRIFTLDQENMLSDYLKTSAKMCHGLTTGQVREFAYQYALKLDIAPEKWHQNKIATVDWLKNFLRRQNTLSVRKPENTSLARTTAFNKVNVANFFKNLEECYNKFKFAPKMIWNIDETGCTTVINAPKVVAETGLKRVGQISSAERGSLVTMMAFVNAAGGSIPPVFIFPRVHFKTHMLLNGPNGALGLANQSGWVTEDSFLEALNHFVSHVKPSKEEPAFILLDNHKTHITLNIVLFARKNNLIILTFPPHCSHRLQPLDVTVFGPFKSRYRISMNNWLTSNPGKGVTIYNVAEFAKDAYYSAFNMQNITSGFKNTGIYPLNTSIFTDDDFLPSVVTDRQLPLLTEFVDASTCVQETNDFIQTSCENVTQPEADNSEPKAPSTPTNTEPIIQPANPLDDPQPSTSVVLSPEMVRPFPKAPSRKNLQKRSIRKGTTKIITSTPEKDRLLADSLTDLINKTQKIKDTAHVKDIFKSLLIEKINLKGKRPNKNKQKKIMKQIKNKRNRKSKETSSSESDDTIPAVDSCEEYSDSDYQPLRKLRKLQNTKDDKCCVCKQDFSTSNEDWFQCKVCKSWANTSCGVKGVFNFFCNLCH